MCGGAAAGPPRPRPLQNDGLSSPPMPCLPSHHSAMQCAVRRSRLQLPTSPPPRPPYTRPCCHVTRWLPGAACHVPRRPPPPRHLLPPVGTPGGTPTTTPGHGPSHSHGHGFSHPQATHPASAPVVAGSTAGPDPGSGPAELPAVRSAAAVPPADGQGGDQQDGVGPTRSRSGSLQAAAAPTGAEGAVGEAPGEQRAAGAAEAALVTPPGATVGVGAGDGGVAQAGSEAGGREAPEGGRDAAGPPGGGQEDIAPRDGATKGGSAARRRASGLSHSVAHCTCVSLSHCGCSFRRGDKGHAESEPCAALRVA